MTYADNAATITAPTVAPSTSARARAAREPLERYANDPDALASVALNCEVDGYHAESIRAWQAYSACRVRQAPLDLSKPPRHPWTALDRKLLVLSGILMVFVFLLASLG